jgi:hypothetical protein
MITASSENPHSFERQILGTAISLFGFILIWEMLTASPDLSLWILIPLGIGILLAEASLSFP